MLEFKSLSRKNKLLLIGAFALIIIVGLVFGAYYYTKNFYNDMVVLDSKKIPETDENLENAEKEIEYEVEESIVNILLVGIDTRGKFEDARTDSMIIATIDPISSKVKLTSLMRDMYVEIPGKGYDKINAAFEYGGIELLKKTIKYNFGLHLDRYAAIDFNGFQKLIDTMGGIELEVKDYEVNETNKYIKEVNGENSTLIKRAGLQILNGQQALSYSRIRKVGNNDYERTERQRKVLSLLLSKVRETKITSYPKLYSSISPYIRTNIDFDSMLKLVYTVYKLDDYSPGSFRIPVDNHFKDTTMKGMAVLIPELRYNANELYKLIYNTVPKNLTVADNSKVYNFPLNIDKKENYKGGQIQRPSTYTEEKSTIPNEDSDIKSPKNEEKPNVQDIPKNEEPNNNNVPPTVKEPVEQEESDIG